MLTQSIYTKMHTFYTGPVTPMAIARELVDVGLDVYVGTEHIYVSMNCQATRWEILDIIRRFCGSTFGLK